MPAPYAADANLIGAPEHIGAWLAAQAPAYVTAGGVGNSVTGALALAPANVPPPPPGGTQPTTDWTWHATMVQQVGQYRLWLVDWLWVLPLAGTAGTFGGELGCQLITVGGWGQCSYGTDPCCYTPGSSSIPAKITLPAAVSVAADSSVDPCSVLCLSTVYQLPYAYLLTVCLPLGPAVANEGGLEIVAHLQPWYPRDDPSAFAAALSAIDAPTSVQWADGVDDTRLYAAPWTPRPSGRV